MTILHHFLGIENEALHRTEAFLAPKLDVIIIRLLSHLWVKQYIFRNAVLLIIYIQFSKALLEPAEHHSW